MLSDRIPIDEERFQLKQGVKFQRGIRYPFHRGSLLSPAACIKLEIAHLRGYSKVGYFYVKID